MCYTIVHCTGSPKQKLKNKYRFEQYLLNMIDFSYEKLFFRCFVEFSFSAENTYEYWINYFVWSVEFYLATIYAILLFRHKV
jgi:hypothetical protein